MVNIILANPRGFCAGVRRAINIVERIIQVYGVPVYVKHELVHNDYVINHLLQQGVIFVDTVNEVPDRSILVFSAHGVSKKVREEAKIKDIKIFDATCPLVSKVHAEVAYASRNDMEVILIGHIGHPEVEGTIGQYTNLKTNKGIYVIKSESDAWSLQVRDPDKLFFVTQTTLSIDDTSRIVLILRKRFPHIMGPRKNDICYATFNRQNAVKRLALVADMIFVIGSVTSSNSKRLIELAYRIKKGLAYLINNADDIRAEWLLRNSNVRNIGITAGASVPDILVSAVIKKLRAFCVDDCVVTELFGEQEDIFFDIPKI